MAFLQQKCRTSSLLMNHFGYVRKTTFSWLQCAPHPNPPQKLCVFSPKPPDLIETGVSEVQNPQVLEDLDESWRSNVDFMLRLAREVC